MDFLNGGDGIRTHEEANPLPVFKTGAFNRSATPPKGIPSADCTALLISAPTSKTDLVIHAECLFGFEDAEEFGQWVVILVNNAFFQRNDCVVGDRDVLGTHLRATLCDVA